MTHADLAAAAAIVFVGELGDADPLPPLTGTTAIDLDADLLRSDSLPAGCRARLTANVRSCLEHWLYAMGGRSPSNAVRRIGFT